ncbi:MAG TPA: tetratricopeptide repeat protein, partial [Ardenticatenaceae bacterium]|nr:tetratricopeptide repeat protein [Ardenticatenaceae bacterium]
SVLLSYYGISRPQLTIAGVLKPIGGADKNVSPSEIAGYVRGLGLGAFVGVNATTDQLERMLSAGFPFLAEQWMEYDGGVGHYRIVRGFDRAKQQILYNDTFLGPDRWTSYAQFFSDWSAYNNTYIVFYPLEREAELRAAIGADWNAATMWERLRAESQARIANGNANGYVWYGLGEALHQQGRDAEAVEAYEQAIAAWLPWRYLWYRYGYFEALNNVGAFEKTLEVTAPVLQSMVRSEDIHYHRGVALRGLGSTNPAIAEFRAALGDNPNFVPAQVALRQMGVDATAPPPPGPTTAAQPTAPPSSPPPSAPEPTSPPEPTAVPVEPTAAPPEPTAVPVEPTAIPPEPTVPPPPEPTAPPPEPTSPPAEPPPPQPTPGDRGG